MSVLEMRRVSIIALASERDLLMNTLQGAGVLHISSLRGSNDEDIGTDHLHELSGKIKRLEQAIELLSRFQARPRSIPRKHASREDLLSKVFALTEEREKCLNTIEVLKKAIDLYSGFGDFEEQPKDLHQIGLTLRLGKLTDEDLTELLKKGIPHRVVARIDEINLVAILSEEGQTLQVETFEPPNESLRDLRRTLDQELSRLKTLDDEAASWAYQLRILMAIREESQDRRARLLELNKAALRDGLIAISGFVLLERCDDLKSALDKHVVALRIEEPKSTDSVPVQLRNVRGLSGFESVIKAFSGVNYFERDKTLIVSLLFMFFGALCLLDAGYGALLFMSGYLLSIKKNKDFGQVFMWTGALSMVLGLMCGQVFGLVFAKDIMLNVKPLLSLATDPMACFKFSLLVGLFSMALTNAVAIYQWGPKNHATGNLFAICCGLTMIADKSGMLEQSFYSQSHVLENLALALGFACVLSWVIFPEPVFGKDKRVANVLWMFYSGPIGLLQDILSHMRLFGIALSGSILALVINKISAILPFYIGTLFAPFGHFLVFLLSLLSLYIHTNRLIFLEFGSKCMNGGNNYFKPFARRT